MTSEEIGTKVNCRKRLFRVCFLLGILLQRYLLPESLKLCPRIKLHAGSIVSYCLKKYKFFWLWFYTKQTIPTD